MIAPGLTADNDAAATSEAAYRATAQLVGSYYRELTRFHAGAQVKYAIHPKLHNLAYLVALEDDVDLASGVNSAQSSEDRARQFLIEHYQLFSFYRPSDSAEDVLLARRFDAQLFLKHSMSSTLGTHCIFGWRMGGVEAIDYCFVVHLDRGGRAVMVASIYLPGIESRKLSMQAAYQALDGWMARNKHVRKSLVEPVVVQRAKAYFFCLQVKLSAEDGDKVCLFDLKGHQLSSYSVNCKAGPARLGLAKVYGDFLQPVKNKQYSLADALVKERKVSDMVLHGLKSNDDLVGRYVTVVDQVTTSLFNTQSAQFLATQNPAEEQSKFDRQMAYYHIDLIQRYFRHLGLDVLDDYEHLNPLQVILAPTQSGLNISAPLYAPHEQRIYITAIGDSSTNARDARILYHEFVHAVTDALARLNRHEKVGTEELRALEIWQAAAIDEGTADYFACSLAVRDGAETAYFYPPPMVELGGQRDQQADLATFDDSPESGQVSLKWKGATIRKLGGARRNKKRANAYCLKCDLPLGADSAQTANQAETMIYAWAEQWGRYLWSLREHLDQAVADTIIAHSIFFLTRWSTFEQGVLAIALADCLLFGGKHRDTVMLLGKSAGDWLDAANISQSAAAHAAPYSEPIDVETPSEKQAAA